MKSAHTSVARWKGTDTGKDRDEVWGGVGGRGPSEQVAVKNHEHFNEPSLLVLSLQASPEIEPT